MLVLLATCAGACAVDGVSTGVQLELRLSDVGMGMRDVTFFGKDAGAQQCNSNHFLASDTVGSICRMRTTKRGLQYYCMSGEKMQFISMDSAPWNYFRSR